MRLRTTLSLSVPVLLACSGLQDKLPFGKTDEPAPSTEAPTETTTPTPSTEGTTSTAPAPAPPTEAPAPTPTDAAASASSALPAARALLTWDEQGETCTAQRIDLASGKTEGIARIPKACGGDVAVSVSRSGDKAVVQVGDEGRPLYEVDFKTGEAKALPAVPGGPAEIAAYTASGDIVALVIGKDAPKEEGDVSVFTANGVRYEADKDAVEAVLGRTYKLSGGSWKETQTQVLNYFEGQYTANVQLDALKSVSLDNWANGSLDGVVLGNLAPANLSSAPDSKPLAGGEAWVSFGVEGQQVAMVQRGEVDMDRSWHGPVFSGGASGWHRLSRVTGEVDGLQIRGDHALIAADDGFHLVRVSTGEPLWRGDRAVFWPDVPMLVAPAKLPEYATERASSRPKVYGRTEAELRAERNRARSRTNAAEDDKKKNQKHGGKGH